MVDVDKLLERWYPLTAYAPQRELLASTSRFKIVAAGRRSGKTELAKRNLVKKAYELPGPYFAGAPTRAQVKRIYWEDLKALCMAEILPRRPSESELTIYLPNGSTIVMIGLDEPKRIEGHPWLGGLVDEFADIHPYAWAENIAPALDTVNPLRPYYRAWFWGLGVPDGLNHFYDLAEYAKTSRDPNWSFHTWHSSLIMTEDDLANARRTLSAMQFRQEYEAAFETAQGRIYEDYGEDNITQEYILAHESLLWFHDFNYSPMSSGIGVTRDNKLYVLDEIVLKSANARMSALEFVVRYAHHENKKVTIYGDPSGNAGAKHGLSSNYTEIEGVLRENGWTLERRVKSAAPSIRNRQNAVRARIKNAKGEVFLYVNIKKAPYMHKGLTTTQLKEGSSFLEAESEYQHITTAIGYCIDYEYPLTVTNFGTPGPIPSIKTYLGK